MFLFHVTRKFFYNRVARIVQRTDIGNKNTQTAINEKKNKNSERFVCDKIFTFQAYILLTNFSLPRNGGRSLASKSLKASGKEVKRTNYTHRFTTPTHVGLEAIAINRPEFPQ